MLFILIMQLGLYDTFISRALYGDKKSNSIFWVCAGMKSCPVTFQRKILYQHFHTVLFTTQQVLTFESLDEFLWCDHSNETSSVALLHGTIRYAAGSNFGFCAACKESSVW